MDEIKHFTIQNIKNVHFQTQKENFPVSNEWFYSKIDIYIGQAKDDCAYIHIEIHSAQDNDIELFTDSLITKYGLSKIGFEHKDSTKEFFDIGICQGFDVATECGISTYFIHTDKSPEEIINNIKTAEIQGLEEEEGIPIYESDELPEFELPEFE